MAVPPQAGMEATSSNKRCVGAGKRCESSCLVGYYLAMDGDDEEVGLTNIDTKLSQSSVNVSGAFAFHTY